MGRGNTLIESSPPKLRCERRQTYTEDLRLAIQNLNLYSEVLFDDGKALDRLEKNLHEIYERIKNLPSKVDAEARSLGFPTKNRKESVKACKNNLHLTWLAYKKIGPFKERFYKERRELTNLVKELEAQSSMREDHIGRQAFLMKVEASFETIGKIVDRERKSSIVSVGAISVLMGSESAETPASIKKEMSTAKSQQYVRCQRKSRLKLEVFDLRCLSRNEQR
eukprot:TRINITY_DN10281_c0_g1_i1.p1 TRINITY_DN10281_c0_g1~~TRINITY_DN10281_c0_g1_i1.p1  ORF type:complete len:223 (+),score=16.95 TRINITY_DN10281_c0_g1_i1:2-670(+)